MTLMDTTTPRPAPRRAALLAAALFLVELIVIGTLFKHGVDFKCRGNWPVAACAGASSVMVSIYCALGAMLLLTMLRPAPFRSLGAEAGSRYAPLGLNLVGVLIALAPVTFLSNDTAAQALIPTFLCWAVGLGAMLAGIGLYIAPAARWRGFLAETGPALIPVLAAGLLAPYFANLLRPLWRLDTVSEITFSLVSGIVQGVGYEVYSNAETKDIGANGFFINVAPQCSGIEGIALVTLFVTLYLWLFRQDLRFPRALLLYPIGILTSAAFNVVRIAALLIIGLGGFHSHAGWLMFTMVALGIVVLAQTVPALQKTAATGAAAPKAAPLPFRQDPIVAAILPFAIFMLSAQLAQAFSQSPSLVYPGRVILMAGVLALFWPLYARLPWRIDPVAIGAGIVIGLAWVLIPVEPGDGPPPYGTLTGMALVGWFIMRGIGTAVLVPIIEELFFRSYLEKRLRLGEGRLWMVMAALIGGVLFAALHDRWAEAFVASLIFSWVAWRRGNITDAIASHAAANLVVFSVAWATGQVHII